MKNGAFVGAAGYFKTVCATSACPSVMSIRSSNPERCSATSPAASELDSHSAAFFSKMLMDSKMPSPSSKQS